MISTSCRSTKARTAVSDFSRLTARVSGRTGLCQSSCFVSSLTNAQIRLHQLFQTLCESENSNVALGNFPFIPMSTYSRESFCGRACTEVESLKKKRKMKYWCYCSACTRKVRNTPQCRVHHPRTLRSTSCAHEYNGWNL